MNWYLKFINFSGVSLCTLQCRLVAVELRVYKTMYKYILFTVFNHVQICQTAVHLQLVTVDRYQRWVARVFILVDHTSFVDLGLGLVEVGLAWVYRAYSSDPGVQFVFVNMYTCTGAYS